MGNHRFRLANMLPNAWFYKLKDLRRATAPNHNPRRNKKDHPSSSSSSSSSSSTSYSSSLPPPHQSKTTLQISHQRKSYYFSRELTPPPQSPSHFPESPRKSSTQSRRSSSTTNARRKRASPRLVTASVSAGCSCRATLDSVWTKPDSTSEDYPNSPLDTSSDVESLFPELGSDHGNDDYSHPTNNSISSSTSCQCRVLKNDDIVIDMNENDKHPLNTNRDGFNTVVSHVQLPPISTKKPDNFRGTNPAQLEPRSIITTRREKRSSPGVRLRTNSPRIAASWKIQGHGRKSVSSSGRTGTSLSDSFAVVKSSADPQRDFKESMVEMILENNIRASKDLEDLLACYLQLNSDEYHELIIKVFKQIWLDFADVRLK